MLIFFGSFRLEEEKGWEITLVAAEESLPAVVIVA